MDEAQTYETQKVLGRHWMAALWAAVAISGFPALAMADAEGGSPSVAMYTATAIGSVVVVALVLTAGLKIAHGLRFIGGERQVRLERQLRVGFGATFLLAAVTPYVAINYSMAIFIPFIIGAGLIIGLWIWATSHHGDLDSGMPTSTRT